MRYQELTEGKNTPCIVVDVQPAYEQNNYGESNFGIFRQIAAFLRNQTGPILMFVNADDQGMTDDTMPAIHEYWEETLEFNDWNRVTIIDKGYGYFRAWMDAGVDEGSIIRVIRLMYQNKVTDSRQLFGGEDSLGGSDDYQINMRAAIDPELGDTTMENGISVNWTSVAQLKQFSGAYIMGGGRNECLREVELLMNAFNIKYKRIEEFVY